MFNAKNQCYQDQYHRNILSGTKFQMNNQQIKFQFDKIEQIDSILSKNDQIYKNLKKQLEQISQAQKNITNNINAIRPIYQYSTYRSKENSLMIYEKFLYDDSIEGQKTLQFDNYESSFIQTERQPYQINNKKGVQNLDNVYVDNEHGNEENSQSIVQKQVQIKENPETNNFRRSNTSDINDRNSQLLIRKSTSSIASNPYIKNSNLVSSNRNLSYSNLRQSHYRILEKQKQNYYFHNNSYEPYIDSIVNMNFGEISHRKKEIEQIYDQLKKQQEQIQQAYQEYKKGFIEMKNMSTNKKQQHTIKSPPKKFSPKKSFFKGKKNPQQSQQNISMSKVSVHSSKIQSKVQVTPISMNFTKQNNLSKRNEMAILQSNEKLAFSPIEQSVMKYCTQEIQSIDIPQRPQKMTALSHVYIPFNKLYKSPIIQMKNKNILILARQSKLVQQKPAQQKILDGKKYKFTQNIQTDEQQLIKNIIKRDHNIIAIVGGQATLKKKLHMAIIAHSFQKIIKIINSKEYNCLTFTLFYHELVDKSQHPSQKISNSIEITEQTQTKKIIQQAQKTIQEIYDAIKRIHTLNEPSGFSKAPLQSNKDKTKIVRFTKLTLMFGKQCIWSCQMFSSNQFTYDFLKNLQVKDIIWSLNPLIKNYDEVSKTLNEAAKYIQNKIQN